MVREMLRSIASPSYVSRASVTVCRHEEEQRGQDASIGLNFEGQKSLEVRVTFCMLYGEVWDKIEIRELILTKSIIKNKLCAKVC